MIPLALRQQSPMLATLPRGRASEYLSLGNEWYYEIKWDGLRALAYVDGAGVQLRSRGGTDLTRAFPEVVAQLSGLDQDLVLDGEVVVLSDGRPNFPAVASRGKQSKPAAVRLLAQRTPATFMVFDLLYRAGTDLRSQSYLERHQSLLELGLTGTAEVSTNSPDGGTMWELVEAYQLEGLIAKSRWGRYEGRRSSSWLKLKATKRLLALVTGIEAGEGSRANTFGALQVSVFQGRDLVSIGRVGSGYSQRDLLTISTAISSRKPVVIEVEYLEMTANGQLRFPVFKKLRGDRRPEDCVHTGGPA